MKLLITGVTGFIGRNLIPFLKKEIAGIQILGIVRNVNLSTKILTPAELCTIEDRERIIKFSPEYVIHLASHNSASDDSETLDRLLESNIVFGSKLLDILSQCNGLKMFVNTGSFSEYKWGREENPAYLYSATKSAFRSILKYYASKCGFKTVSVILYSVYGGLRTQKRLVDYIMDSIGSSEKVKMSPGAQRLDFIHMDDVCNFYFKLLKCESYMGENEEFHVGSGSTVTPREIVGVIEELTKYKCNVEWGGLPYRPNDIMYACAPLAYNINKLGWTPTISILEEGLKSILKNKK